MKIYYGTTPKFTAADHRSFSRGNYECKRLLKTGDETPVVISKCKDKAFPVWKVEYGFSCVVFDCYEKAMAFCKGRFYDLDGRAV